MRRELTIPSHAKVNLSLRIVGKREDGYHDIETVFQSISLLDTVTVEVLGKKGISITTSNPTLPVDSSNLCWKAADLFRKAFGVSNGVRIHIEKRIPVSAGLGGGSGNAAATLLALARLLGVDRKELFPLAEKLGSDVPFFLTGFPTALGRGRGEILEELHDVPDYRYLLVNPGIAISAGWAYGRVKGPGARGKEERSGKGGFVFENDLEAPAFAEYPLLKTLKDELLGQGADQSLMSGSGSTLFGVFSSEEVLKKAREHFREKYPGFLVVQAETYFPKNEWEI